MKWILVLAAFGFNLAFAKINSINDFKKSLATIKKSHPVLQLDNQQSQEPPEPPAEPIRFGKVKLTLSKGTFQTDGDNKWSYDWSSVCSKETTFPIYKAEGSWSGNNIEVCATTFNGKEIELYYNVFSVEGEIEINPNEKDRHAVMYALPVYAMFSDQDFPIMRTPVVALEERAHKAVFIANEPEHAIICAVTRPIDTVPKPEPNPNPNPNKSKKSSQMECTANWKEIFKVTAEILD